MSAPQSQTPGGIKWNEHKAGLEGVDRKRVQEVINELSKGSKFYVREQKKAKELAARVSELKKTVEAARRRPERLDIRLHDINSKIIPSLESQRVSGRVIACFDFDCFFAAVEALDNPTLVGVPHAVGGSTDRGVLSTASYEARRYGVRSAQPIFIAKSLCPQLKIVKLRIERYKEMSNLVQEKVLAKYDPGFRMGSIDEGYLDLTHLVAEGRSADEIVTDLREEVKRVTGGLTISVGVAPNCLVAKIAVDMKKPDGQTVILPKPEEEREELKKFLAPLALRKVPGIGRVLESHLSGGFGVKNVGDVLKQSSLIAEVMDERTVRFLLRTSMGIGQAHTFAEGEEEAVRKGISKQRSFAPESNEAKLMMMLREIAEILEDYCRKKEMVGARVIVLKLKRSDFVPATRNITVPDGGTVCTADDFMRYAGKLLRAELPIELRLLGIGLQKLTFKDETPDPKSSIVRFLKQENNSEPSQKLMLSKSLAEKANGGGEKSAQRNTEKTVRSSQKLLNSKSLAEKLKKRGRNDGAIQFHRCSGCRGKGNHEHSLVCPVCNMRCFNNNSKLNRHIDECLNLTSDALKDAVSETKEIFTTVKRRRC